MKKNKKKIILAMVLFSAFVLWTIGVKCVDVRPIGPRGSSVGFAKFNQFFSELIGVNFTIYTITDWLGLVPFVVCICFGVLGLVQWIKRKCLWKVDYDLLILGAFYAVVIAAFVWFEISIVNYRPVLIEGRLEASYPSSTTMLVMCVMPTCMMQLKERIKNNTIKKYVTLLIVLFTVFTVVGRVISGVHWITDIIGGVLLSSALVASYYAASTI